MGDRKPIESLVINPFLLETKKSLRTGKNASTLFINDLSLNGDRWCQMLTLFESGFV